MHKPPLVFCYCFDPDNTVPAIVSAQSLIDTLTDPRRVTIVMMTTDPDFKADQIHLRGKDVAIEARLTTNPFTDMSGRAYVSAATFMRFSIASYIDEAHGRVLYLDADTVFRKDSCAIFDVELHGAPLAAVEDFPLLIGSRYWDSLWLLHGDRPYRAHEYMRQVLDIDPDKRDYVNCGVLLIDLSQWADVAKATVEFLRKSDKLHFLDQDALSAVLKGNFVRLDPKYNAISDFAFPDGRSWRERLFGFAKDFHAVRKAWREKAEIVHYAGGNKPWLADAEPTAFDGLWWDAARNSSVFARVAHLEARKRAASVLPRRF